MPDEWGEDGGVSGSTDARDLEGHTDVIRRNVLTLLTVLLSVAYE